MNAARCHEGTPEKLSQDFPGKSSGAHNFKSISQPHNQFPQLIMPTKQAWFCVWILPVYAYVCM